MSTQPVAYGSNRIRAVCLYVHAFPTRSRNAFAVYVMFADPKSDSRGARENLGVSACLCEMIFIGRSLGFRSPRKTSDTLCCHAFICCFYFLCCCCYYRYYYYPFYYRVTLLFYDRRVLELRVYREETTRAFNFYIRFSIIYRGLFIDPR